MTRGYQTCLTIAFLALIAKLVGTYGIYSVARDVHETMTGSEILRLSLAGDAARDLFRARGIGSDYLAATLHLQVVFLGLASLAYAAAANGNRKAAAFMCVLVIVALPVDLPLGLVHLVHLQAGSVTGLPAELTWSWLPRNPFAIMQRLAKDSASDLLSPAGIMASMFFFLFLVPGMLAASVVLAGLSQRDPAEDAEVSQAQVVHA